MRLNGDLSVRIVRHSEEQPWQPSPSAGVQRRLLSGEGGEDARATSVVRYEPGASFSPHAHPQGEEIMVLDGELEALKRLKACSKSPSKSGRSSMPTDSRINPSAMPIAARRSARISQ